MGVFGRGGAWAILLGTPAASTILGCVALILYLATLSRANTGDTLHAAIAVRHGDVEHLLVRHRPLVLPIAWSFGAMWQLVGLPGDEVLRLQVLSALAGAACVVLVHRIAVGAGPPAMLGAAGFGVSAAPWSFSTDGEQVTVPLCAALTVVWLFVRMTARGPLGPGRIVLLAGAAAIAGAVYLANVWLLLALALGLLLDQRMAPTQRWQRAGTVGWAGAGLLAAVYTLVGLIRPTDGGLSAGLYGGFANPAYGSLGLANLPHGLLTLERSIAWSWGLELGGSARRFLTEAPILQRAVFVVQNAVVGALLVALVIRAGRPIGRSDQRPLLMVLGCWMVIHSAFAIVWVPGDMEFWLPVVAALWITVSLTMPSSTRAIRAMSVGVAILTLINLVTLIGPNLTDRRANDVALTRALAARLGPDDAIVTNGTDGLHLILEYHGRLRVSAATFDGVPGCATRVIPPPPARSLWLVRAEPAADVWEATGPLARCTADYLRSLPVEEEIEVNGETVRRVTPRG